MTLIDCDIKNIQFTKGSSDGNTFTIGAVFSSSVTITASGVSVNLENEDITIKIGVLVNGAYEYITIGKYTVTKVEKTTHEIQISGAGFIATKMNDVLPDVATQTIANVLNALRTKTGLTISLVGVSASGTITESLSGLTCREVLEVVAFLLGGYATENAGGGIEIHKFAIPTTKLAVNGDRMLTPPVITESDYAMTGIKVVVSDKSQDEEGAEIPEVEFHTSGAIKQTYQNRYMTQALFTAFANNVVGYTFRPADIDLSLGDPRLEPWDCLAVTDLGGDTFNVPCHQIQHTFDGGFATQISARGETDSDGVVTGSITQRLERYAADLITAKEAILSRVKADELEATVATFGYMNVSQADLRYATISALNAEIARINNLVADHVSISDLQAAEADIEDLKVGDLTIGGVTVNIYDLALAIKNSALASSTYWYKVAASEPSAPTLYDPTSQGWSLAEPAYSGESTSHLYSCMRVVYADDDPTGTRHFQWSDVHLIQSWEAAKDAYTYASQAADDAVEASSQAMAAAGSANAALTQLGIVEDVVGILNWVAQHGTYVLTGDNEVVNGKYYFTLTGSDYMVVTNPTGDPNAQGWYELAGIDEAVTNYVASHLALTGDGLYIQTDGVLSKVLLSSDGVTIFGPDGSPVAEYGSTAKIGDPNGFHIELSPTELGFYQGRLKVAYVSNNQLYITQSVVLERMDLGTPVSQGGLGQWSWKVHEVDGMNNLYLKWIG